MKNRITVRKRKKCSGQHDLAYDGLFQMTLGWGYIEIPIEYKLQAIELYDIFKEREKINNELAKSLTEDSTELIPFLSFLLQDLWDLILLVEKER